MADSKAGTWVTVAVVLALLAAAYFLWRPNVDKPAPPDGGNGTALSPGEVRRLVEIKDRAIAQLENGQFDECIAAFEELVAKLPHEPLGHRNLTIACILLLKSASMQSDRLSEHFQATLAKAQAAANALLEIEGDSGVSHILASKVARLADDESTAFQELRLAAQHAPDDPVVWFQLFSFGQHSENAEIRDAANDSLRRTYELRPNNLYVLKVWLQQQAKLQDATIAKTLEQAKQSLRPFFAQMQQLGRIDVAELLDKALANMNDPSLNDKTRWSQVSSFTSRLGNLVVPLNATRTDLYRLDRDDPSRMRELEFVAYEFKPEFQQQVQRLEPHVTAAIPVKLTPLPEQSQLSQLESVLDAMLVDVDLDDRLDVVALTNRYLEVHGRKTPDAGWQLLTRFELPFEANAILAADLDRDYVSPQTEKQSSGFQNTDMDLVLYGEAGLLVLENRLNREAGTRTLHVVPQDQALQDLKHVSAAALIDFDHEGDLDLVVSAEQGLSLWANRDNATFEDVSQWSDLPAAGFQATALLPVDWNRDVGIDLLLTGLDAKAAGFLENVFHGRFRWQPFEQGFDPLAAANSLALLDADENVSWDVLSCGSRGVHLTQSSPNLAPGLPLFLKSTLISDTPATKILTWDFDNDSSLDVLAWSEGEIEIAGLVGREFIAFRGTQDGQFEQVLDLFESPPSRVEHCDVGDLDGDGDLDLLVVHDLRITLYANDGGNRNHSFDVLLRADAANEQFPHLRSNMYGIGSLLELKVGGTYQPRVVTRPSTHFGLGQHEQADVVRVLWTNGIPTNQIAPKSGQPIHEQQDLKGSCPYLHTWTGERFEFFTDLLWSAPLGLQLAEGVLAPSRSWEYLKIPGDRLVAADGEYRLQITEELWEAAYFDTVQLLAVDHPADVDIFSNEKVGPAEIAEFKIHTVRNRRVPLAARDKHGRDALPFVAAQDDVYFKGFDGVIRQGLTDEHFLELDLGPLSKPQQLTLFLTGWIHPTDTSINVSLSQNPQLDAPQPPSVWVPDAEGRWQRTIPYMGFPGGKTKTIAVDLSDAFLTDDYRLRIVTSAEIYWDAVFYTVDEPAADFRTTALPLISADLHDRGISRAIRHPQFGPERYDYADVSPHVKWPPMRGHFTRFGDVAELLAAADDRLVVMGAGDEMTVRFRADAASPPAGWKRDFLLHNVGWDKDADLNTVDGQTVEPLPFRSMSQYPYGPDESYPDSPGHHGDLERYQTRTQDQTRFWRHIRDFAE